MLYIVLPAVLVPIGLLLAVVGYLAMRSRLPRNRFLGVRTEETLRSDAAFRLANRVAAPALLAGGVIAVLTGALAPVVGNIAVTLMVALVAAVVLGVLLLTAGRRANLVAALHNERNPVAAAGGCGGCDCGADGCANIASQAAESGR